MRCLFLDFDGVLNNRKFLLESEEEDPDRELDPKAMRLVNDLISRSGAEVVVSSSWRMGKAIPTLQRILDNAGFNGRVLDATPEIDVLPDGTRAIRGNEIQHWLTTTDHEVESFVILDDDSDMGDLMPYLVQTSFDTGITQDHVERALGILLNRPV